MLVDGLLPKPVKPVKPEPDEGKPTEGKPTEEKPSGGAEGKPGSGTVNLANEHTHHHHNHEWCVC